MADQLERSEQNEARSAGSATKTRRRKSPAKTPPKQLPRYKVLLHNDDHNHMSYVVTVIQQLTALSRQEATIRMWEAHTGGLALLLVTHKERAELYVEQFASCRLTVTTEPES